MPRPSLLRGGEEVTVVDGGHVFRLEINMADGSVWHCCMPATGADRHIRLAVPPCAATHNVCRPNGNVWARCLYCGESQGAPVIVPSRCTYCAECRLVLPTRRRGRAPVRRLTFATWVHEAAHTATYLLNTRWPGEGVDRETSLRGRTIDELLAVTTSLRDAAMESQARITASQHLTEVASLGEWACGAL